MPDHPAIREKESLNRTLHGDVFICPKCREECERIYFKSADTAAVVGCDNCVEFMDSMDYIYYLKQ